MAAQDGSRSHLRWRSEVNEHGRDGQLVGARCVDAVASCARAAEAHQTGGWYGAGARACVVGTTDALGRARREGSWARHTSRHHAGSVKEVFMQHGNPLRLRRR